MAAEIKKQRGIDVVLHKGSGGVFEVVMDGRPLFSKKAHGRFPEPHEVLDQIPAAGP